LRLRLAFECMRMLCCHKMKRLGTSCCCVLAQVDYHLIVDLLPVVTQLFFLGKLPSDVQLSRLQVNHVDVSVR
jgi:hypothetical protein